MSYVYIKMYNVFLQAEMKIKFTDKPLEKSMASRLEGKADKYDDFCSHMLYS